MPATGLPADNVGGDLDAGDPRGVHLADQHRRLPVEHGRRARHRADRPARGARTGWRGPSTRSRALERHERVGHVLQLVRPDDTGEKLRTWPDDGNTVKPFLSSVDNGWLATGAAARRPRRARAAPTGRRDPRGHGLRLLLQPGRGRSGGQIRGGFWDEDPQEAAAGHRRLLRHGRRRLVHRPPLRRLQHRAADRVLPRHRRRPDPGASTTSAPSAPSPTTPATGPGPRPSRSATWTTYLGVDVFEGALPYRGMHIVPTWGGSMFEALMVPLFVPEEKWGPRSWGLNHPLYVRGQIEHGMDEAGYGYWGFSPSNNPAGGYREYGVDQLGIDGPRLHLRPGAHRRRPALRGLPRGLARADVVRRRRGHPARVVPGAALRAEGAALGEPRQHRATTSTPTARAASTTPSRCAAARSRSATSPSTRAW